MVKRGFIKQAGAYQYKRRQFLCFWVLIVPMSFAGVQRHEVFTSGFHYGPLRACGVGVGDARPQQARRTDFEKRRLNAYNGPERGFRSVQGLQAVLEETKLLDTYGNRIATWCDEQGAACLDEIVEVLDELAADVALDASDKTLLAKALAAVLEKQTRGLEEESVLSSPIPVQETMTVLKTPPKLEGSPIGSIPPSSLCFASLTRAANAGDAVEAKRWFAAFEQADPEPRLTLITAAGMAHDYDAAETWFAALTDKEANNGIPTAAAIGALIGAYCRSGEMRGARARFDEFVALGFRPNRESFNSLIMGYAAEGNAQDAEEFFDRMRNSGLTPTVIQYSHLVQCYASATPGLPEKVEATLLQMAKEGIQPDKPTVENALQVLGPARLAALSGERGYTSVRSE